MSASQVARITPAIRQVLDKAGDGWCATIEIVGVDNAWAQVMKGSINLAYPFATAPNAADVAAHLPGAVVTAWEANTFATFGFEDASEDDVARAVDALFTKFFKRSDYSVESRIENFDE